VRVRTRTSPRRRRGFTLLEVMLVVTILVALAAVALPRLIGVRKGAQVDEAKLEVKAIDEACQMYFMHTGQFPSSSQGFAVLETPPSTAVENWRGPYLKGTATLRDPWGQPYNYVYPGKRTASVNAATAEPDIWSNGPDGQTGTADDIGNWPTGTQ
jgi:general secretion pathway protein G